jgi:NADH-quinone oxidoreductase subunit K
MIEGISIQMILTFTTVLFFIGLYGFLTRTNLIGILMSVELMLNSEAINFVAINTYLYPDKLEGGMFSLFILAIAAAETALALAIILQVFKRTGSIDVKEVKELKY